MKTATELSSARMKLQRCEEHLGQLQAEHERFIRERNPYRMLPEDDFDEPGYKLWRAKIVEQPPVEKWGSLAGECVHSLRAALDHTAFAVVQINRPGTEHCEFPIMKDAPADRTHPSKLPGVDRRVLAQVNWLEPYRRGGALDRLWIVHALDIIDKHRRLNLVRPSLLAMDTQFIGGEFEDWQPFYGPFEDGAVVARYKVASGGPNVYMQTQFAFDITFGESKPPIGGEPVMRTLHELMVYVGGVVARFDRFF